MLRQSTQRLFGIGKKCIMYMYVHMYAFISTVYLIWASFIFSWQIVYVYKQKVIYALDFYFWCSQININKDHALI